MLEFTTNLIKTTFNYSKFEILTLIIITDLYDLNKAISSWNCKKIANEFEDLISYTSIPSLFF